MKQPSCRREFARYAFWNVMGMIGLSCYILADTFFVSQKLGSNGLAALNLAIPVYSLLHGSGLMLGMGGATRYAIFKGQKAFQQANEVFTDTLYSALPLAAVMVLSGACFSDDLALLLGADAAILDMTGTYLKVILLFAPAFLLNNILICFVRNDGNPGLSMAAMLGGSFSNIVLDYLFLFPFQMGMFGAVLATGLATLISMMILSILFWKKQNQFRLNRSKPHAAGIRSLLSLGFPSLITEVSSGIVMIAFNFLFLTLQGKVGVAAYGVIANLSLVVFSVYTGLAQGSQPILSRAYGRGDQRSVKQVLRCALTAMLVFSCLIYTMLFLFAGPITGVFNSEGNAEMQEMTEFGLKRYFIAIPFAGFNIILALFFTSTENAVPAHWISLLRGLVLMLPMVFLLSSLAGLTGTWLAFPVTEGLVAVLGQILYRRLQPRAGKQNGCQDSARN